MSSTLQGNRRLETLKDVLDGFLPSLLGDLVELAIVTFSTVAKVQHPLMAVNHQTVEGFRDAVKNMSVVSRTCIGCGLQRALEVLNTSSETPEGAIIVLLTDGMENEYPSIDDAWPQLLASKVQVVTMAMGDNAEGRLEELAAATKGQSYFFPDPLENAVTTYIEGASSQAYERTYHQSVMQQNQTRRRVGIRVLDNYTFVDTLLGKQKPTAPFQRVTVGTYFMLTSNLQQKDVPPGRIWDFRAVSGYVEIDRTPIVCLTWTWPGAHMTHGKATEVEIRGGTDEDYLQSHFDSHEVMSNVVKGNLQALAPGSQHEVTIALPRNWATSAQGVDFKLEAYLGARVINAEGLKSKLSNTVLVPFEISNFTAYSMRRASATTTRASRQPTNPVPGRTAPETPYEDKDAATTTTPAKVESGIDDKPSVITWILLALVAGFVVVFVAIILLYRARASTTIENQGPSTNTQTATTM
nr:uncharacterized protein LOC129383928 [Dermacentor andersoni]